MPPIPFQFIEAKYISDIMQLKEENEYLKSIIDKQFASMWIKVSDRLPTKNGWYLVVKFNEVRVAEWNTDSWYNENDMPIDNGVITHWQPLPNLPNKEN